MDRTRGRRQAVGRAAWAVAGAAGLLLQAGFAAAQGLAVAAASDLQAVLPGIAARFERETGEKVALTFGSSGNFFTQIQNGAPFDVLLSADSDYPRRLEASGQAVRGTLYEYATGRLALWTRSDSGLDVRAGLVLLTDARVRKIAIANPQHAPYGRAAVAALRHEHVYEPVRDKLVLGENISQAAQFVQSGNAQVGVLALSLARSPTLKASGVYLEIPAEFHPPIEQAAVVLAGSRNQALARRFIEHLKKPETLDTLQGYGFAVPQAIHR